MFKYIELFIYMVRSPAVVVTILPSSSDHLTVVPYDRELHSNRAGRPPPRMRSYKAGGREPTKVLLDHFSVYSSVIYIRAQKNGRKRKDFVRWGGTFYRKLPYLTAGKVNTIISLGILKEPPLGVEPRTCSLQRSCSSG